MDFCSSVSVRSFVLAFWGGDQWLFPLLERIRTSMMYVSPAARPVRVIRLCLVCRFMKFGVPPGISRLYCTSKPLLIAPLAISTLVQDAVISLSVMPLIPGGSIVEGSVKKLPPLHKPEVKSELCNHKMISTTLEVEA